MTADILDEPLAVALDSERIVMARILLEGTHTYLEARSLLSATDWWSTGHEDIWRAMAVVYDRDAALSPTAVMDQLRTTKSDCVTLIVDLTTRDGVGELGYHCQRIANAACLRALTKVGQGLIQRAQIGQDPVGVAEESIHELRLVQSMGLTPEPTELDFLDIVARPTGIDDFVIPGLLAPMNRFILTAGEGWGKSSLVRQIAACTAAGVHPFHPNAVINPKRVLVIDAENPEEINTEEYRRVYDCLDNLNHLPGRGMLTIEEAGPMNLLDGRQAARLYKLVERVQPSLIAIGPIYQLHEDNPNDEGPARKLSAVLDRIRTISRAALIVEAHSPHSDGPMGRMLRPFGASLWKRWPEFGYCLEPATPMGRGAEPVSEAERELALQMRESKLTGWRGARAKRDWPKKLGLGQRLPWEVYP